MEFTYGEESYYGYIETFATVCTPKMKSYDLAVITAYEEHDAHGEFGLVSSSLYAQALSWDILHHMIPVTQDR